MYRSMKTLWNSKINWRYKKEIIYTQISTYIFFINENGTTSTNGRVFKSQNWWVLVFIYQ